MDHFMPIIYWHDRKGLLSVDLHHETRNGKYRLATASVQKEVRVWEFEFEMGLDPKTQENKPQLTVGFLANLVFHNHAINQVKFSPSKEHELLASGDCEGRITIWKLSDQPVPPPQDEMPSNKENWIRYKVLNHNSDVNALCWDPSGTQLASVSNDHTLAVHDALTGKRLFVASNFRSPNGVCWDPSGKYIATMSPDRKMDLIDAVRGARLKHFSSALLPSMTIPSANGDLHLETKIHKLFHDDQLFSFQRALGFSPNGEFIAAPCAHLELGSSDLYGTYFFRREDLGVKEAPYTFYPAPRPTFLVKFSPVTFSLLPSTKENHLGLPYRLLWIALNKDAIYFYDSQHSYPVAVVDNIHLNALTDASFSHDGRVLVVSSLEGFCSFVKINLTQWGEVMTEIVPVCGSPNLIEEKKQKKRKSTVAVVIEKEKEKEEDAAKSPMRKPSETPKVSTPKAAGTPLTKFFKKENNTESPTPPVKKRIQLVTLDN
ncbi:CAF1B/HIR1 beta-propeller domain-containing protein [Caenorhabditis elegans]|uniref:CAF1B/HIR1 beta-propeller domain-containing protein n=1 Tax=Caenorhabditis elegans TaxID=6239 RepID=Q95XL9_CAEEL|nr:WD_REPEATS_REGION domain-containing protein [Caenorhabditis elegans]CCD67960.1 WD_REPEATS_REGION domain-containing protein [Caenorhabditis elegans]|eukprot:NP_490902.2 CHromatin Assembly Factor [Caenorhabditis elegans]